ncbi:hypothetical protein [Paenibacillus xylanexedens]|uniref:hypothetical protein n=1 Tax=Paenibacillus xylanexedens TaxID=528191 RepID=UPI00119FD778|nr:hypothetical protein [Paenibacillus xylanexedens]
MNIRNLRTNTELLAAALLQVRVTIREQDGQIADYGGPIEGYSDNSVKIGGTYYVRGEYEFEAQ